MKKAVLAVSFGTSYPDTLEKTITAIERALAEAFPDRQVFRAFTSGMVIQKLRRLGLAEVDTVPEAMERMLAEGVDDLIIQPTHIINGEEYDRLRADAAKYAGRFAKLAMGTPLLTAAGDYRLLADALLAELPPKRAGHAVVLMGHGSSHFANSAYAQLEYLLHDRGRTDILIGTVEGYPGIGELCRRLAEQPGVRTVLCAPLLIVAGEHAKNDMSSDDPSSWRSRLTAEGYAVQCLLKGLGEYPGVRTLFAAHAAAAREL